MLAEQLLFAKQVWNPGAMLFDVFGGSGQVGFQSEKLGVPDLIFEISRRPSDDVCSYGFKRWISKQASGNKIGAIMCATPCPSFSVAVSRSGRALRSQEEPRGKDINMTAEERSRIALGNRCLDATWFLLRIAYKFNISMCVENPMSSYIWWDPAFNNLIQQYRAKLVDVSQCAFGARWRKHTRLLFLNVACK